MFNNTVRFILIAACLLIGIVNLLRNEFYFAALFFITGALFAYGYFRYGSVWLAFQHLKNGEMVKAERLLDAIKNPQLLSGQQKAYYFFSKGLIEENRNNLDLAESCLKQALSAGLRTTNDTSLANLNLADIYYRKGMLSEARDRLKDASKLPHKQQVAEEIQKLKDALDAKGEA
jgi:tetratricopeptide (TPR) repeat protein